jgi:hypothetical protein
MTNEDLNTLKAIELILDSKDKIEMNPFKVLPKESIAKALQLLEDYSQDQ